MSLSGRSGDADGARKIAGKWLARSALKREELNAILRSNFHPMIRQVTPWFACAVFAVFAGCASIPPTQTPPPAPAPPAATVPELATPPTAPRVVEEEKPLVVPRRAGAAKTVPQPAAQPALPAGEYALQIESEPSGATVVMNGKPCGKTPCRVVLAGNARGFLREQVSLKVRFIAADASQSSQTVEEVLTPLDRVPTALRFTPAGATRVVR